MPRNINVRSYRRKGGIDVRSHTRSVITSREQGRSGERFKKLEREVAKGYVGKKVPPKYQSKYGKTYSKKEALEVGKAVAGKTFWRKEGKRRGRNILRRER